MTSATAHEPPSFTCPCCGAVCYHPKDVEQAYCGVACHWWTGDPALGPPHLEAPCEAREARKALAGRWPFTPDWTLRPGVLLGECLRERGQAAEDFATASGLDPAAVRGILDGTARVDEAAAEGFASAIGTSSAMWLKAQAIYDEALARGATDMSDDWEGKDDDA